MDPTEYQEAVSQAFGQASDLVARLGYLILGVVLLVPLLWILVRNGGRVLDRFRGLGALFTRTGRSGTVPRRSLDLSVLRWGIAGCLASVSLLRYLVLGQFRRDDDWYTTEHRLRWCWSPEIAELALAAMLHVPSANGNPSREALVWAYHQDENTPFGRRVRRMATDLRNEQWRRQQRG